VNDLLWVTLSVPDLESSRNFWRDVIGLAEKSYAPAWCELELKPGIHLALHAIFNAAPFEKRGYDRGGPVLGIRVDSLSEMASLVQRSGAHPLSPVQDIGGGQSQDFEDPDGYVFELVELAHAEARADEGAPAGEPVPGAPPMEAPPG
jgi:catechol 2,3-dioxygenase-like lactoylglutathione lyase family enzyme